MSVKFKWHGDDIGGRFIRNRDASLLASALAFQGQAKLIVPKKTHNLERSISVSSIQGSAIYVGTNVKYAPYVEYGTRFMAPRAFFRKTIDVMKTPIQQIFRSYLSKI